MDRHWKLLTLAFLALVGGSAAVSTQDSPAASSSTASTAQRTFVATTGSDTNPCSRAQPCRSFAAAVPKTTAGGEVVALDSGGYGAFTIDRSVTIAGAPGQHVAITVFSGIGIDINPGASGRVILRNLYLNSLGGSVGVWFASGAELYVDGLVVDGFTNLGIGSNASNASVVVHDTLLRSNGTGINISSGGRAEVSNTRAERSSLFGFRFQNGAKATVRDSAAVLQGSASANSGVSAVSANTDVTLVSVVISDNDWGLTTSSGAVTRTERSTITRNVLGVVVSSATGYSFGNNAVHGNGTDGSFTATVAHQ